MLSGSGLMGIRTWCPCCGQRYPVRARLPRPGHFYGTMPAVLRRMHRVTFRCCHGAVRGSLRRRADRKQRSSQPRLLVFFIFQLAEVGNMLYTLNKTRVSVRIVLTDHAHQVCGKKQAPCPPYQTYLSSHTGRPAKKPRIPDARLQQYSTRIEQSFLGQLAPRGR